MTEMTEPPSDLRYRLKKLLGPIFLFASSGALGGLIVTAIISMATGEHALMIAISGSFVFIKVGAAIGFGGGLIASVTRRIKRVAVVLAFIFVGAFLGAVDSDVQNAGEVLAAIENYSPRLGEIFAQFLDLGGGPFIWIGALVGGYLGISGVIILVLVGVLLDYSGSPSDQNKLYNYLYVPLFHLIGGFVVGLPLAPFIGLVLELLDRVFVGLIPADLLRLGNPLVSGVVASVFGVISCTGYLIALICDADAKREHIMIKASWLISIVVGGIAGLFISGDAHIDRIFFMFLGVTYALVLNRLMWFLNKVIVMTSLDGEFPREEQEDASTDTSDSLQENASDQTTPPETPIGSDTDEIHSTESSDLEPERSDMDQIQLTDSSDLEQERSDTDEIQLTDSSDLEQECSDTDEIHLTDSSDLEQGRSK